MKLTVDANTSINTQTIREHAQVQSTHRIVLVIDAVADEMLLDQQLLHHSVVDAWNRPLVALDKLFLCVSNRWRRESCKLQADLVSKAGVAAHKQRCCPVLDNCRLLAGFSHKTKLS